MFHTPLYGLRADCRQSAGRARWPAHPGYRQNRPQKAPHGDRQDSKAFLSQPSFLSRLGRLVTFRRGGFALARISSDHCQQMCRMQISDRWVGKNCEICGLAAISQSHAVGAILTRGSAGGPVQCCRARSSNRAVVGKSASSGDPAPHRRHASGYVTLVNAAQQACLCHASD